jgi:hypothetical protein
LQTQPKIWFWRPDLAKRYNRTPRTIMRWEKSGRLPPPTMMPNGRPAWANTIIEAHERNLVSGGETA